MRYALISLLFLITPVAAEPKTAHDFSLPAIDGKTSIWPIFAAEALLVVNTASYCGFTKQYDGLQALWQNYRDKGLIVLGVPSNDFGQQEPGSKEEIQAFCSVNFDVDFPMSDKLAVKGARHIHFINGLKRKQARHQNGISKFLIAPDGRAVRDFSSLTKPQARKLLRAVEAVLPEG